MLTHMIYLVVYGLLVFEREDLGDGDVLALVKGHGGPRVRVYSLPKGFEVDGIVFDALEEFLLVGVVARWYDLGYCVFYLVYS